MLQLCSFVWERLEKLKSGKRQWQIKSHWKRLLDHFWRFWRETHWKVSLSITALPPGCPWARHLLRSPRRSSRPAQWPTVEDWLNWAAPSHDCVNVKRGSAFTKLSWIITVKYSYFLRLECMTTHFHKQNQVRHSDPAQIRQMSLI